MVVLAIGQADVLNRQIAVQDSLMQVWEAINGVNSAIILLVCTPLPWPTDEEKQCHKLFRTTLMLKEFCTPDSTLQFIRATQEFISLQGLNSVYFNNYRLTVAAAKTMECVVSGKINCGKLRQHVKLLIHQ